MASSVVRVQSLESCSIKDRKDSMAFSCLLRLFFSFFRVERNHSGAKRQRASVCFAARRLLSCLMINLSTKYHLETDLEEQRL